MGAHLDARRIVMAEMGREVTLRRLVQSGAPIDLPLQGFDRAPAPLDVAAGIQQQDRVYEILNDEIAAASWPLPIRQNDKILDGGRIVTVQASWGIHEGSDVIGHRIWVKG